MAPLEKIVNLPDWHLTGISIYSAGEKLYKFKLLTWKCDFLLHTASLIYRNGHKLTGLDTNHWSTSSGRCAKHWHSVCYGKSDFHNCWNISTLAVEVLPFQTSCKHLIKSLWKVYNILIWVLVCFSCSSDCQLWICTGDTVSRQRRRNDQWRICFRCIPVGPVSSDSCSKTELSVVLSFPSG